MTNREGWLNPKKLPRNHMIFKSDTLEGLVVVEGKPYAMNGQPLPMDVAWLKKNRYTCSGDALRALRPPEPEVKTKECDRCQSQVPIASKYCPECGNSLGSLWVPGDGGEGERIRKMIDPEDPLGSLEAMANPLDQKALSSRRKKPEEMEATEEEILAELEGVQHSAVAAVPGEAPTKTNPRFRRKAVGTVSHGVPTRKEA